MRNVGETLSVSKVFSSLRELPNLLTQAAGQIYDKKLPEKIAVYVLDHFEKFRPQIKTPEKRKALFDLLVFEGSEFAKSAETQPRATSCFKRAVELNNQDPTARRKLAEALYREANQEGNQKKAKLNYRDARLHVEKAILYETDPQALSSLAELIQDYDPQFHPKMEDFKQAKAFFQEAARVAEKAGKQELAKTYQKKALLADEQLNPYKIFDSSDNKEFGNFLVSLRSQGIPLADLNVPLPGYRPNREISVAKVAAFTNDPKNVEIPEFQKAILDFLPKQWISSKGKEKKIKPEILAEFKKVGFLKMMADYHAAEADRSKNAKVKEKNLLIATHFEPGKVPRYKALGDFYLSRKEYSKALGSYHQAFRADPSDVSYYLSQGKAHEALGEFSQARTSYKLFLQKNPGDAESLRLVEEINSKDFKGLGQEFDDEMNHFHQVSQGTGSETVRMDLMGSSLKHLDDLAHDLLQVKITPPEARGETFSRLQRFKQVLQDFRGRFPQIEDPSLLRQMEGMSQVVANFEKEVGEFQDQQRKTLELKPGSKPSREQLETAQQIVQLDKELKDDKVLSTDLEKWADLISLAPPGVIDEENRKNQYAQILKEGIKVWGHGVREMKRETQGSKSRSELNNEQNEWLKTEGERIKEEKERIKEISGQLLELYGDSGDKMLLKELLHKVIDLKDLDLLPVLSADGLQNYLDATKKTDALVVTAQKTEDVKEKRKNLLLAYGQYTVLKNKPKMGEVDLLIGATLAQASDIEKLDVLSAMNLNLKGHWPEREAQLIKEANAVAKRLIEDKSGDAGQRLDRLVFVKGFYQSTDDKKGLGRLHTKFKEIEKEFTQSYDQLKASTKPEDVKARIKLLEELDLVDRQTLEKDLDSILELEKFKSTSPGLIGMGIKPIEKYQAQVREELKTKRLGRLDLWQKELTEAKDLDPEYRLESARSLLSSTLTYEPLTQEDKIHPGEKPIFSKADLETRPRQMEGIIKPLVMEVVKKNLASSEHAEAILVDLEQRDPLFLANLKPDHIHQFIDGSKVAHDALKEAKNLPRLKALQKYIEAAQGFAQLGSTDRVKEALSPVIDYVKNARGLSVGERFQAFNDLAVIYQSAGMKAEANQTLEEIRHLDLHGAPRELREWAEVLPAQQLINEGKMIEARALLDRLSGNSAVLKLIAQIEEGQKQIRVGKTIDVLKIIIPNRWKGYPDAEKRIQAALATLDKIQALVASGEFRSIDEAIEKMGMKEGESPLKALFYDVVDAEYGHQTRDEYSNFIRSASNPTLSDQDFEKLILGVARSTLKRKEKDYTSAQMIAERLLNSESVSAITKVEAKVFIEKEIPETFRPHQSWRERAWGTVKGIATFNPVGAFARIMFSTSDKEVYDSLIDTGISIATLGVAQGAGRLAKGFFYARATGGELVFKGFSEGFRIVSTGGAEATVAAAVARSPLALRLGGWAVGTVAEASAFTLSGTSFQSLRTWSLDPWNPKAMLKDFGGQIVMFGLLGAAEIPLGRMTRGAAKGVAEAEEALAAAERSGQGVKAAQAARRWAKVIDFAAGKAAWAGRVGALSGSNKINTVIGLHDEEPGMTWWMDLVDSALTDVKMGMAGKALDKLTNGMFHKLEMEIDKRYDQNQRAHETERLRPVVKRIVGDPESRAGKLVLDALLTRRANGESFKAIDKGLHSKEVKRFREVLEKNLDVTPDHPEYPQMMALLFGYAQTHPEATSDKPLPTSELVIAAKALERLKGRDSVDEKSAEGLPPPTREETRPPPEKWGRAEIEQHFKENGTFIKEDKYYRVLDAKENPIGRIPERSLEKFLSIKNNYLNKERSSEARKEANRLAGDWHLSSQATREVIREFVKRASRDPSMPYARIEEDLRGAFHELKGNLQEAESLLSHEQFKALKEKIFAQVFEGLEEPGDIARRNSVEQGQTTIGKFLEEHGAKIKISEEAIGYKDFDVFKESFPLEIKHPTEQGAFADPDSAVQRQTRTVFELRDILMKEGDHPEALDVLRLWNPTEIGQAAALGGQRAWEALTLLKEKGNEKAKVLYQELLKQNLSVAPANDNAIPLPEKETIFGVESTGASEREAGQEGQGRGGQGQERRESERQESQEEPSAGGPPIPAVARSGVALDEPLRFENIFESEATSPARPQALRQRGPEELRETQQQVAETQAVALAQKIQGAQIQIEALSKTLQRQKMELKRDLTPQGRQDLQEKIQQGQETLDRLLNDLSRGMNEWERRKTEGQDAIKSSHQLNEMTLQNLLLLQGAIEFPQESASIPGEHPMDAVRGQVIGIQTHALSEYEMAEVLYRPRDSEEKGTTASGEMVIEVRRAEDIPAVTKAVMDSLHADSIPTKRAAVEGAAREGVKEIVEGIAGMIPGLDENVQEEVWRIFKTVAGEELGRLPPESTPKDVEDLIRQIVRKTLQQSWFKDSMNEREIEDVVQKHAREGQVRPPEFKEAESERLLEESPTGEADLVFGMPGHEDLRLHVKIQVRSEWGEAKQERAPEGPAEEQAIVWEVSDVDLLTGHIPGVVGIEFSGAEGEYSARSTEQNRSLWVKGSNESRYQEVKLSNQYTLIAAEMGDRVQIDGVEYEMRLGRLVRATVEAPAPQVYRVGPGESPAVIVRSPRDKPTWRVKGVSEDGKSLVLENIEDPTWTENVLSPTEHPFKVGEGVEMAGVGGGGRALPRKFDRNQVFADIAGLDSLITQVYVSANQKANSLKEMYQTELEAQYRSQGMNQAEINIKAWQEADRKTAEMTGFEYELIYPTADAFSPQQSPIFWEKPSLQLRMKAANSLVADQTLEAFLLRGKKQGLKLVEKQIQESGGKAILEYPVGGVTYTIEVQLSFVPSEVVMRPPQDMSDLRISAEVDQELGPERPGAPVGPQEASRRIQGILFGTEAESEKIASLERLAEQNDLHLKGFGPIIRALDRFAKRNSPSEEMARRAIEKVEGIRQRRLAKADELALSREAEKSIEKASSESLAEGVEPRDASIPERPPVSTSGIVWRVNEKGERVGRIRGEQALEFIEKEGQLLARAASQAPVIYRVGPSQSPALIIPSTHETPTWRVKEVSEDGKTLVLENVEDPSWTTPVLNPAEHSFQVGEGVEVAGIGGGGSVGKQLAEQQRVIIRGLMRSKEFGFEMASWQDGAYYRGQGQEPPPFNAEPVKKEVHESIAMNLAGFYAVESGVGYLCERTGKTPLEVFETIIRGELPEADMLILARFANATWKAGQPFRSLDRITRDNFIPAVELSPEELQKDFQQIRDAATLLQKAVTSRIKDPSNLSEQNQIIQELMQSKEFAREMAAWLEGGYYRGVGQTAPEFNSQPVTKEVHENVAMSLAGFYAVESGVGLLAEQTGKTPVEILAAIVRGELSEAEMILLARFANATWKAGQPFRSMDRITRPNFIPAVKLSEAELKKDFDQIRAAAEKILERVRPPVEPQGSELIDGGEGSGKAKPVEQKEKSLSELKRQQAFASEVTTVITQAIQEVYFSDGNAKIEAGDIGSFSRGTNNDETPDIDVMVLGIPTGEGYQDWTRLDTYEIVGSWDGITDLEQVRNKDPRLFQAIFKTMASLEQKFSAGKALFKWVRSWSDFPGVVFNLEVPTKGHGTLSFDINLYHPDYYFGVEHGKRFNELIKNIQEKNPETVSRVLQDIKRLKQELKDNGGKTDKKRKVPGFVAELLFTFSDPPPSYDQVKTMMGKFQLEGAVPHEKIQSLTRQYIGEKVSFENLLKDLIASGAITKGGWENLKEVIGKTAPDSVAMSSPALEVASPSEKVIAFEPEAEAEYNELQDYRAKISPSWDSSFEDQEKIARHLRNEAQEKDEMAAELTKDPRSRSFQREAQAMRLEAARLEAFGEAKGSSPDLIRGLIEKYRKEATRNMKEAQSPDDDLSMGEVFKSSAFEARAKAEVLEELLLEELLKEMEIERAVPATEEMVARAGSKPRVGGGSGMGEGHRELAPPQGMVRFTIGREGDYEFEGDTISRIHTTFAKGPDGQWYIHDGSIGATPGSVELPHILTEPSSDGTKVFRRGEEAEVIKGKGWVPIHEGDKVRFGNQEISFRPPVEAEDGRSQLLELISKKTGQEIKDITPFLSRSLETLEALGWDDKEKSELLVGIAESLGPDGIRAYDELFYTLDILDRSGWSKKDQIRLFLRLAEKSGKKTRNAFMALPDLLRTMEARGWNGTQQFELLIGLAERLGEHVHNSYECLLFILRPMEKMGWSYKRHLELIFGLAESAGGKDYWDFAKLIGAINALEKVGEKYGWNDKQQLKILLGLVEVGDFHNPKKEYKEYEEKPLTNSLRELDKTGWKKDQQLQFLLTVAKAMEGDVYWFFGSDYDFADLVGEMKKRGWSSERQIQTFTRLLANGKKGATEGLRVYSLIFSLAPHDPTAALKLIDRVSDQLNDYNRTHVFSLLTNSGSRELFRNMGYDHFLQHLQFYAEIFERWPRLGYGILEGVLQGTQDGLIPADLGGDRTKILHFIEQTNDFSPGLYKMYLQHGESIFLELKNLVPEILADEMSGEEAQRVIGKYGEEFLLGIIQMVSPTSGASFVNKDQKLGLLKKMMKAGDLRGHIPEAWRGKVEAFALKGGEWRLQEGKVADPEGKFRNLLHELTPSAESKVEEKALAKGLTEYLQSGRASDSRDKVRKLLYRIAGQNEGLRQKVDSIQGNDYADLLLIEQVFEDKDNIPEILADALNHVPEELLKAQGKKRKIEGNGDRLVKSLKKTWNETVGGRNLSEEKRAEILGSILKAFEAEEIEAKILSRPDVSGDLKNAIREVMHLAPALSKKQVISEILSDAVDLIRSEKGKYAYQEKESVKIGLRAVKGPGYALHGLTSGVCIAPDVELWKNPNFKLFAMTDENRGQVVGYVHVFETVIEGKKYLTLPGINPSAEFMGSVNSKNLYEGLMEKITAFAQAGGYQGIYIPTHENIHSNRSDIHKVIERSGYKKTKIPEVRWNKFPSPYPFTEVYVAWKKPLIFKIGEGQGLGVIVKSPHPTWRVKEVSKDGKGLVLESLEDLSFTVKAEAAEAHSFQVADEVETRGGGGGKDLSGEKEKVIPFEPEAEAEYNELQDYRAKISPSWDSSFEDQEKIARHLRNEAQEKDEMAAELTKDPRSRSFQREAQAMRLEAARLEAFGEAKGSSPDLIRGLIEKYRKEAAQKMEEAQRPDDYLSMGEVFKSSAFEARAKVEALEELLKERDETPAEPALPPAQPAAVSQRYGVEKPSKLLYGKTAGATKSDTRDERVTYARVLKDGNADLDLRIEMVWKLVDLKDPATQKILEDVLLHDRSDYRVRFTAADALAHVRDARSVPALTKALASDADEWVRRSAAEALGEIGDPTARPALEAALINQRESEHVREAAATALGEIKDPASHAVLEKIAQEDENKDVSSAAAAALKKLSPKPVSGGSGMGEGHRELAPPTGMRRFTIGREGDYAFEGETISRIHATFAKGADGQWYLHDGSIGSTPDSVKLPHISTKPSKHGVGVSRKGGGYEEVSQKGWVKINAGDEVFFGVRKISFRPPVEGEAAPRGKVPQRPEASSLLEKAQRLAAQPQPHLLQKGVGYILGGGRRATSESNYLPILDRRVSQNHLKVRLNEDGTMNIQDLGSQNGTWVIRSHGQWDRLEPHKTYTMEQTRVLALGSVHPPDRKSKDYNLEDAVIFRFDQRGRIHTSDLIDQESMERKLAVPAAAGTDNEMTARPSKGEIRIPLSRKSGNIIEDQIEIFWDGKQWNLRDLNPFG